MEPPFEKFDGRAKAWKPCKPPEDVAELILTRASYGPFLPLRGVLAAPSLRPDGTLIERAGYDDATGMYLFDPPPMPDVPDQPTMAQGRQALNVLDGLLAGFPWQGDDDARAVRPLRLDHAGRAPGHAYSAATLHTRARGRQREELLVQDRCGDRDRVPVSRHRDRKG